MEKPATISAKRYLSVDEIAEYLGVSKFSIYRWIDRREIPFIPMGRMRKFDPVVIDEWMKKRSVATKV